MLGHLRNTRELASAFIHYHKEDSKTCSDTGGTHSTSRNTAPAHISCDPKAVSFEKGLEEEGTLQDVQTVIEEARSSGL